jgi:hypothetical protein
VRADVRKQVEEETAEERGKAESRRARVLAHPDIAVLLCRPPLNMTHPQMWSGYIPPRYHMGKPNPTPVRTQILAILNKVVEREEWLAKRGKTAPETITDKTLQILHICLGEYGIDDRDEKLRYLSTSAGRTITTSREMHEEEGQYAIGILRQLIIAEKELENATEPEPDAREVVSEVTGTRLTGGADGAWPTEAADTDDADPPY